MTLLSLQNWKDQRKFLIFLPVAWSSVNYSSRIEVYKFVAWGSREGCLGRSNLDLPIYFSKVSAQLPVNELELYVDHRSEGVST